MNGSSASPGSATTPGRYSMAGGFRTGSGKKPIPDHLKLVKGTLQNCRKKASDAKRTTVSKSKPVCPPELIGREIFYFDQVVGLMGSRASETFIHSIALLAGCLADIETYRIVLRG